MISGFFKKRRTGSFPLADEPMGSQVIEPIAESVHEPAPELGQLMLAQFPGVVVLFDATSGEVETLHSNLAAVPAQQSRGCLLHDALGVSEDSDVAAMWTLWLACVSGTDSEGWSLQLDEAPRRADAGGTELALDYAPIYEDGALVRVLMFARLAEAVPASEQTSVPRAQTAPAVDPVAVETFRAEAQGLLTECSAAADRLQTDPSARHAVHKIFRAIHTLKGNARAVHLDALQAAAHSAEDELEPMRAAREPLTPEQIARIRSLIGGLRDLIGEAAQFSRSAEVDAPQRRDSLARVIAAVDACRHLVVHGGSREPLETQQSLGETPKGGGEQQKSAALAPHRGGGFLRHPSRGGVLAASTDAGQLERVGRELLRAIDAAGVRPLGALHRAAVPVVESLHDPLARAEALALLEQELARVTTLVAELGRSDLPEHFVAECAVIASEIDRSHDRWCERREDPLVMCALLRAIDAARSAAESFAIESVRVAAQAAMQMVFDVEACVAGPDDYLVVELLELLDAARAIAPLAPQERVVDALASFHDEARKLLSQMQRGYERWSTRLRDKSALARIYELAHSYAACARRYRFPALSAHARELHELLDDAMRAERPQRSITARVEAWLTELDEQLRLYQSFMVEVRSADGRLFLERAIDRVASAPPPLVNVLEELATEAESLGILTLRQTLSAGTSLASARLERLFRDASAFTVRPAAQAGVGHSAAERAALVQTEMASLDALTGAGRALSDELHEAYGRLRRAVRGLTCVPVRGLADRLGSLATDLGEELGKPVELRFEGASPLVEESRLRKLGEILLHAVRNAIDHGLEDPADRVRQGKPERGIVRVQLEVDDERLRVTVGDDGRGIDRDRVRRRAIDKGLVDPAHATQLIDTQIDELLFLPGFSTAERVSTISGRGVGMDAIKLAAEELGGTARIGSSPGIGTRLVVDVPLDDAAPL